MQTHGSHVTSSHHLNLFKPRPEDAPNSGHLSIQILVDLGKPGECQL